MNTTMERLIALRDLLELRRDLADTSYEKLGFEMGGAKAIDTVDAEIANLKAGINPRILRRYETIAAKYDRPLVPVRKGICYGCLVHFPTGKLASASNEPLVCENCGRLVYPVS